MKISTKALLLSALVFPGSGHIYLKSYLTGLTLISITLVSMYYLIEKAIEIATQIVAEIQNGNVPLDAMAINDLITRQLYGTGELWLNIAIMAVTFGWAIGILDSYRLGVKQERDNHS